jgi:hypothetical protein
MKKYILLGLLLVIIVAGVIFFNVPQRIGLAKSPAEKLLEQRLDHRAADAITQELREAGVDTRGLTIYVIPYKDSDESLAVAVLDASQGFDINSFAYEDSITEYLSGLADAGEKYGVKRVAVDYKNENGDSLLTMTAPAETVVGYSEGSVSQQEFLEELEGKVNFVEVAKVITEK